MANTPSVAITGSGVFTPSQVITNDELVVAFNVYADRENDRRADDIASGNREAIPRSSAEFIKSASGIEQRFVLDKAGVLDPDRMYPKLAARDDEAPSQMAEMAVAACTDALAQAGILAGEIDVVICAASNHERAYPAIAIEIQDLMGDRKSVV